MDYIEKASRLQNVMACGSCCRAPCTSKCAGAVHWAHAASASADTCNIVQNVDFISRNDVLDCMACVAPMNFDNNNNDNSSSKNLILILVQLQTVMIIDI